MSNLLILGAGGHGRVVAEAAELEDRWDKIAFLDDRIDVSKVLGFNVVGGLENYTSLLQEYEFAFVAMGDNLKRMQWMERLIDAGYKIPVIIHPGANVSKYSTVGDGTVVLVGTVVNTGSSIGRGCIINIGSCVDHDCEIGDVVHICSGAVVRSMCRIGRLSFIGAGAVVKSGVCLEENFLLGDGEV